MSKKVDDKVHHKEDKNNKENKDDKEDKEDKEDKNDKEKLKEDDDEFEDEKYRNSSNYQNKIWMFEILDDLHDLLNYYVDSDYRLKWVGISDILYGPGSCNMIKYDDDINEFIYEFLNEIDELFDQMERKNLEIAEDDQLEFERLMTLNKEKIYSRIAYCLETWFINR